MVRDFAGYRPNVIRANIIIFFFLITIVAFALLAARGFLTAERIWLGLILILPYALATVLGERIFKPDHEATFRLVAFVVILGAVLLSLPLWS